MDSGAGFFKCYGEHHTCDSGIQDIGGVSCVFVAFADGSVWYFTWLMLWVKEYTFLFYVDFKIMLHCFTPISSPGSTFLSIS